MTKYHVIEMKGRSAAPQDWAWDGEKFRHVFFPERDVVLFDSEEEALAAVADAPRRPDSHVAVFKWVCTTWRECQCPLHR